jgi:hypothetical protein
VSAAGQRMGCASIPETIISRHDRRSRRWNKMPSGASPRDTRSSAARTFSAAAIRVETALQTPRFAAPPARLPAGHGCGSAIARRLGPGRRDGNPAQSWRDGRRAGDEQPGLPARLTRVGANEFATGEIVHQSRSAETGRSAGLDLAGER